jgi:SAM-dependent methyltransferase
MQSLDPARQREALTYYHRTGPIGDVLAAVGRDPAKKIGAVGLGAGSLASFATPRQAWTYFEIDPVVLKLARDERYFTFLRDTPANLRVVLGDARRSLAAERDAAFDLLILDAYSSDAIPMHLVTREALALYALKLAPGGVLAFHISNLHLDLEPVFGNLARDAHLVCLTRDDTDVPATERALGKSPSVWLVMARNAADFGALSRDSRWVVARVDNGQSVWTDDYSSLLSVFRWR